METVKILMPTGAVDVVTDLSREEIKERITDAKMQSRIFVEFEGHRLDEKGDSVGKVAVGIETSEIKGFMVYEYKKPTPRQILEAQRLPGMVVQ